MVPTRPAPARQASSINPLASRTTLPGSETGLDYTFSGPSITLPEGTTYVWGVDDLSAGTEGTITVGAQRHPGLSAPRVIANTVDLSMDGYGPFTDSTLMVVGRVRMAIPLALSRYEHLRRHCFDALLLRCSTVRADAELR